MRCRSILAGIMLALATTAQAQDAVLLRVGGQVGQINKYQSVMNTFFTSPQMMQMGADTSQPMLRITSFSTRTMTSIAGDTLVFAELIDSARGESPAMPQMSAMMGGGAANAMRGQTTTTRMDARGRMFSVETSGGGQAGGRGGMGGGRQRAMYVLPEAPVRVGQSWTDSTSTPAAGDEPARSMMATFRLERVDNRGATRVAVIAMDGNMVQSTPQGGSQRFTIVGQFQVDLTASRLAQLNMTMQGNIPMGRGGDVPARILLESALIP